ncbi:MAG TPA: hypothetical protein VIV40_27455 [Kofleriaceae bacterium]
MRSAEIATPLSWFRLASIATVAIIFARLAFGRRWMCDDGLIVTRAVRQLLDGNGPVFNAFERVETSTSTLWTYLLAALGGITGADLAKLAVYAGLVLATAAIVIAMAATARLRGAILPGSVLVVLGVCPFWDFATSGLENGLCFAWLALCWWLLVTLARSRLTITAFVLGLGPLVRPDFGLVSIVFLAGAWYIERPSRRRTLLLAGVAIALPLAYEIFRAGYYGLLVPLPALTKSAAGAEWARGWIYLRDFAHPYVLWVPLAALLGPAVVELRRGPAVTRERVISLVPIASGCLLGLYVVRVGGDFMHARMLLAPLFLLLLPTFMLPASKLTIPAFGVLATWALVIGISRGDGRSHVTGPGMIADERLVYLWWTHRNHPIEARMFVFANRPRTTDALMDLVLGQRRLLAEDFPIHVAMNPARPGPLVYAASHLGTAGAAVPLDAIAADVLGLANPIGARITRTTPGASGHEKTLPPAWLLADYADPSAQVSGVPQLAVDAAQRAMRCGELAELLESARAPLTWSRFWSNLTGALRRTRLVIPADPLQAEHEFCAPP